MTNRFMMSVAAAALIAGSGFAYAQGTGSERSSGGSNLQQSAPSGGSATSPSGSTTNRDATESTKSDSTKPSSGMKATQSDQKSPGATQNQRADEKMGQKSKNMSADEKTGSGKDKDMKAEGQKDRGNMNAEGQKDRNGNMNAETKGTERSQTTGQAGGGAKLSTEQRTKITGIIRSEHVEPMTTVNFEIRAGARVPRDVRFYPLPQEIVTIYPQWRGYEYILVRDQIIVVNPRTLEIVDVIDV
jgi:hypothetical protein